MLKVLTEWETVMQLIEGRSIARYGDGELKICRGASAKSQPYSPDLALRLRQILFQSTDSQCLVGIPRLNEMDVMPEQKQQFWAQYTEPRYTLMCDSKKQYASAFITRPDSIPEIDTPDYFATLKSVWAQRDVVVIGGDNKPFDSDPTILEDVRSFERWKIESQDAWASYPSLFERCLKVSRDTVFILSAGPTATVLAFDLDQLGYQALDMGHVGMFYRRLREKIA